MEIISNCSSCESFSNAEKFLEIAVVGTGVVVESSWASAVLVEVILRFFAIGFVLGDGRMKR